MNDHIFIYWDDLPLDKPTGNMRAGKKPNNPITQDIRKAIAHLEFELERQIHLQSQDEQRATSTTNEGINVNYAVLY
jgi:hypothetical protein